MVLLSFESEETTDSAQHQGNRAKLHRIWSQFPLLESFSTDLVRSMAWSTTGMANPFQKRTFSVDEVTDAMMSVNQHYGKVRDIQCHQLKEGLVEMDTKG